VQLAEESKRKENKRKLSKDWSLASPAKTKQRVSLLKEISSVSPRTSVSAEVMRKNEEQSKGQLQRKISGRKEIEGKRQSHREMVRGLFGNLDFLVGGGLGCTSRQRIPNTRIIKSAVICIGKLETSLHVQNRIYESLLIGNRRLKEKLAEMNQLEFGNNPVRPSLFHCDQCSPTVDLKGPKKCFLHYMECHPEEGDDIKEEEEVDDDTAEDVLVLPNFNCSKCHINFPDFTGFQMHNLLHQHLVLFHCPVAKCGLLFGVPSKLKRHYFLDHGTVLTSEDHLVLSHSARVKITRKIHQMIASLELGKNKDSRQIDNFLEAHLDAKLVRDEIEVNEAIEKMTDHEFIAECKKTFSGKMM